MFNESYLSSDSYLFLLLFFNNNDQPDLKKFHLDLRFVTFYSASIREKHTDLSQTVSDTYSAWLKTAYTGLT